VDRKTATENLKSALLTASIALAVFGLSWFLAIIYIG
jgi:hypothetical protein